MVLFKRAILLLLVFYVLISGVSAQEDERISIHLEQVTAHELFSQLNNQIKINFVYSNDDVKQLGLKSYEFNNASLSDIIEYCLQGSKLTYEIEENTLIIKPKPTSNVIEGKIVDDDGLPLPGANVRLSGSNVGTISDIDGNFAIKKGFSGTDVELQISFIGMKSKSVKWTGTNLQIKMQSDILLTDEVIVTGYQVIDKKNLTSSVSSIEMKDIIQPEALSVDQMLSGKVPGLSVSVNSGEIGVAPKVRVRGVSTLAGNREPLWVVDGIVLTDPVNIAPSELNDPDYINRIGNAISGINPQDVERIDVLKDASATALYGARAANGVIVITTKKGRAGKMEVNYSGSTTLRVRPRYSDKSIDLMNSKERVQFSRELMTDNHMYISSQDVYGYEALNLQLYRGLIDYSTFQEEVKKLETNNTDWFDLLMRDAWSQNHSVSISGGSENTTYRASLGYNDTQGVTKTDNLDRYTASMDLQHKFNNLSVGISIFANTGKQEYYQQSLAPNDYAYNTSRVIPAYDELGQYKFYKQNSGIGNRDGFNFNILNEMDNSSLTQRNSSVTARGNFDWRATDWFKLQAITSMRVSNTEIESWWGENTYYAANLRYSEDVKNADPDRAVLVYGGELGKDYTRNKAYTVRIQADINKYFGTTNQHNINASVGLEANSNKYDGFNTVTRGYMKDRGKSYVSDISFSTFPKYAEWLGKNVPVVTDNLTNLLSEYATASYSYGNYFTVNGNMRIDSSNKFGDQKNNKFLPIWSGSFMYNLATLLPEETAFDYLRLKASYGFQGNMLDTMSPETIIKQGSYDPYFNEYTSTIARYPNPNLSWEKTRSSNISLNTAIWNNRIQAELSYFYKETTDAFIKRPISAINGYNAYMVNGGDITNKGYSVDLTLIPISKKDLFWTISASFTKIENRMNNNAGEDAYELQDYLDGTAIINGESIGTFYSYKFAGLNPEDGGPMFNDGDEETIGNLSKYDTFTTVLKKSGRRDPNITGGINTSLRYKKWRVNANFSYSLGAKTRLLKFYPRGNDFASQYNVSKDFINRWKKPGDEKITDIPAVLNYNSGSYYDTHWSEYAHMYNYYKVADNAWSEYNYSDLRVVSANYLQCTYLSLSYGFPDKLLKKLKVNRAELTLSGSNLFTIADKALKGQTPTQSGFDKIQLSQRPSFSLGLNVTF